ncbi:MAG: alanine racemase [Clostridia bacterium]|nr:alanine racemase [Clostridia bacterium]
MNRVIIEKANLEHNIKLIKDKVRDFRNDKGESVKIIAVIKGNAYGMDSLLLARRLIDNNINFFAVSELEEAIYLRNNKFNNPILLLQSTSNEDVLNQIVENNLVATISSFEEIEILNRIAKEQNKNVEAHLKIDTGFGRFGFFIDENNVLELANALNKCENLKITGTYSHFIESYANDDKLTRQQFNKFIDVIAILKKNRIETGMLHICNSSAIFKYPEMYLNAVRVGSAFTGRLQISNVTGLKRVGYFETTICEIKELKKDTTVGYSATCKLKKDTKVAITTAGYAEGIGVTGPKDSVRLIDKLRKIKLALATLKQDGRTFVTINNKKYPIVGRIGMKNFMIDVSDSDVEVGDKVKVDVNLIFIDSKIKRQEI